MDINKEHIETKLSLWLYDRGFLGLIRLSFEFLFSDGEKIGKKLYKEIFE